MIPVIVKLCESPSRVGGLLMINYCLPKLKICISDYFIKCNSIQQSVGSASWLARIDCLLPEEKLTFGNLVPMSLVGRYG